MINHGEEFQRQGKRYRATKLGANLLSCDGCCFRAADCFGDAEIPSCCSIEEDKAVIFEEVEHVEK